MLLGTKILLAVAATSFIVVVTACPLSCSCKWKGGKQTVECVNKSLPTIPEGIDGGTQVLDMSGNPINSLPRGRFMTAGLTNLQKIFVARCLITYVDESAFRGLSNLVELDLSDNAIADIPSKSFDDYPSLMKFAFGGNTVTSIKTAAFKRLSYLTVLDLSGCRLETIEPGAFDGLSKLEWLRLDNNRIVRMESFNGGPVLPLSLHGIEIHHNPWMCDCNLLDIHGWLNNNSIPQTVESTCHSPERLRGLVIKKLSRDELACAPTAKSWSPAFQETEVGKNLTLSCRLNPPEVTATISWLLEGRPINNNTALAVTTDTTADLLVPDVTVRHNGTFTCIAENRAGQASCNFTVRVIQGPSEKVAGSYSPAAPVPLMMVAVLAGGVFCFVIVAVVCIISCRFMCSSRKTTRSGKSNSSAGASGSQETKSTSDIRQSDSINLTVSSVADGKLSSTEDISVYEYEANNLPAPTYEVQEVLHVAGYDVYQPSASPNCNTLEANPDLISDASTVVKDNGNHHRETTGEVYKLALTQPSTVCHTDYWSPNNVYPMMTTVSEGYDFQQLSPSKLMTSGPYPPDYGLPKIPIAVGAMAYPPDYGLPKISPYPPPPALYRTLPYRRNAAKPQGRSCQEAEFVLVQHRNHHHHNHLRCKPPNVRYNQQGYPFVTAGPNSYFSEAASAAYYEQPPSLSNASAQTLEEEMQSVQHMKQQPSSLPAAAPLNSRPPEQHKAVTFVQKQSANSESPDEGYVGEGPDS
ncbi:leucine-rich repeat-containing protein 24-like [Daktulosphaira vitifoliae]|uniref:leucine-rich repeat-containing protein 24-like n=1 Tax=Daktulosphaira vitifoliae TaxID=58002 RepID=UPI0021A98FAD|nr:leucine-rich repeat-containing protein 24-like [Daktulosphaira vitifoliae]